MKNILMRILIEYLLVTVLSITTALANYSTLVVIGEPIEDELEEIIIQPPPEPPPILATIDIEPNTLNLKSSGKFITAFIKLPDGHDLNQIDRNTIQISEIGGHPIEPILADRTLELEIEEEDGLAVKFDRKDLENVLVPGDEVEITIEGLLTSGRRLRGVDAIRVIEEGKCFPLNAREKRFIFHLSDHLSSDSRIIKAIVWTNYGSKEWLIHFWGKKIFSGKWLRFIQNRLAKYYFLALTEGDGYEWDLTEIVKENWAKGIFYVTISIDYDKEIARGYPALIITYEQSSTAEEAAIEKQNLIPIAPRFSFPEEKNLVKLFFRQEDIEGLNLENIAVCGWNESTSQWEVMPDSTLDSVEQSVSTQRTGFRVYQIMYVRSSSSVDIGNPKTKAPDSNQSSYLKNFLGQNYPNPFNPSTTIDYTISQDCHVSLKLYNICGQLVATIVDEYQRKGSYSKYFDGGDRLSRGIYYYQLKAGDFVDTKRMVILK